MSAAIERIKKLIQDGLLVDAIELPCNYPQKTNDIEEVLSRFDQDLDDAYFIIRVKRSNKSILKQLTETSGETHSTPISIEQLVNETIEEAQKISQNTEDDPVFLLENAKLLEQNKDFDLAQNIYLSLIQKKVFVYESLEGLARTYEKQGLTEKAQKYYEASRRMQS